MADALIRLLGDAPLREQISRNAREAAKAYTETAVVEAHLKAYEAIAAGSV
jgi:glycosyltransferase involved in cell wall biosynthesis